MGQAKQGHGQESVLDLNRADNLQDLPIVLGSGLAEVQIVQLESEFFTAHLCMWRHNQVLLSYGH